MVEPASSSLAAALQSLIPAELSEFFAVLELGYLAASADGLDDRERATLADVLAQATGTKIDRATFDAHFQDLETAVAALGRRERLARSAADLETADARANAIRFAALVAMADGKLDPDELAVLAEAGGFFELAATDVRALVDDAAARIGGKVVTA